MAIVEGFKTNDSILLQFGHICVVDVTHAI